MKSLKSTNVWATEKYKISFRSSWETLFKDNFFENGDWNHYHREPESNRETWYVNENFFIVMTYFISLQRCRKLLFQGNKFENVGWNYYHQKLKNPEIYLKHGKSTKKFLIIVECHVSFERSWKSQSLFIKTASCVIYELKKRKTMSLMVKQIIKR